jgi:hypothetical protein
MTCENLPKPNTTAAIPPREPLKVLETTAYWLNEKRLKDHKIALIGEKIARAASRERQIPKG